MGWDGMGWGGVGWGGVGWGVSVDLIWGDKPYIYICCVIFEQECYHTDNLGV